MKLLPLSDATVLQFLAPAFVAVLAPITIQEAPSRQDTILLSLY